MKKNMNTQNNVAMIVWNEFRNDARVLKEASTLQSAGYNVTVHALHTPDITKKNEILPNGIRVKRISRSPLWKFRKPNIKPSSPLTTNNKKSLSTRDPLFRILARLIVRTYTHFGLIIQMIRSKPDIVHAHDVNTLPTAWLVSLLTRTPLVYDAHEVSTDREGYTRISKLVGWIENYLMPRAVATITTTSIRAKFFARAYHINRPTVLQNRPTFQHVNKTQRIRDELNLPNPWPIALYQGGLQQGRGLETLIKAASQIPNTYFVFIGGGRLENKLHHLVQALALEDRVHFIPTVSLIELPSYTMSADLGIQPLENTCFNHFSTDSNKLFEYIMAGLPVVASNFPEIRHVINTYDVGILSKPGDMTSLVAAIQQLVSNSEQRKKYSSNTLVAAKDLSWEEQQDKLLNLYNNVTNLLNRKKIKH